MARGTRVKMKIVEPRPPNRESYSIQKIAEQWHCPVHQVESYIFDYKLLRLAVVTEHIQEFQELAPAKLGVFLANSDDNVQSLYAGITDASTMTGKIDGLNLVDLNHPLAKDGAYEFVDVDWTTNVPRFLYINLNNNFVTREGRQFPIRHLRLEPKESIRLTGYETLDGESIEVRLIEQNKIIETGIRNFVITREERDRFVDLYGPSSIRKSTGIASEQKRLLTIIGLLTLAFRRLTGNYFDRGKTYNSSSLAKHVSSVVQEETGLKESSVKRRIAEGLSLVLQKK